MEYFKVKKNDKDDDKSTEYTQIDYKILYDLVKSNDQISQKPRWQQQKMT